MMQIILAFFLLTHHALAQEMMEGDFEDLIEIKDIKTTYDENNEHAFIPSENEQFVDTKNIENLLEKMENIAALAQKSRREGILPTEDTEDLHNRMVENLEDIIEHLKNPHNTYKFLNSKGVDRIITPIIGIKHEPLKKQLLILLKTLFNVAPTTTTALIPISIVDKLLDIFEYDENLVLKSDTLDILYIWLPNNPKIQARVMRLKGLEPFYQQVSRLDNAGILKLVDLFNKILEEHLKARNSKSQNKEYYEKMKLYQMIGLIERMSSKQVCNGLLNILEVLLNFTDDDMHVSSSIFDLIKNIKPFCSKIYKRRDKAVKIFDALNKYIANPIKMDSMQNLGLNVTEIKTVVQDFANSVKDNVRDEF